MSSNMSPIMLLEPTAKTSLFARVETVTGKQNPVEALLHFANDVQNREQYKTRQRLHWSKKEDKQSSKGITLPRVPSVNLFDKFAPSNTDSAKKLVKCVQLRTSECSVPATPRIVSASSSGAMSARVRHCRTQINKPNNASSSLVCVPREIPQHSRNMVERSMVVTGPSWKAVMRTSSQKSFTARLAEAHASAGMFIIPTISLRDEDDPPAVSVTATLNDDSVQQSSCGSDHALTWPQSSGRQNLEHAPRGCDSLIRTTPELARQCNLRGSDEWSSDANPWKKKELSDGTRSEDSSNRSLARSSTLSVATSLTNRSSLASPTSSKRWSCMTSKDSKVKEERLVQQLEEIVEESRVSDNIGREKRQQLQQQHSQQIAHVQELTRTLQQLQPQESTEITDSLAALRQMMGGASIVAHKLEVQSTNEGEHPHRLERINSKTSKTSKASSQGKPGNEDDDFTDISLPPLCGTHWSTDLHHRQPRGPVCSLALSCSSTWRKSVNTNSDRKGTDSGEEESDSDVSDGSNSSETYESSSYSKMCRTPTSTRSKEKSDPSNKHEQLKNLWKRNIALVRLVGRMGVRPVDHEEDYDEHCEHALGALGFSHEDLYRLAMEHSLPFEKVVRARKLFLRHDKDLTGVLGPEEVQFVLRDMYKHLHQNNVTIPQTLQTSPSSWGSAKFPEVVRWLAQSAFDEASLVPPEQMHTRELAKEWGVDVEDVEHVEAIFSHVGIDKGGFLDFAKFKQALRYINELPEGAELPASRVNLYWTEIDNTRTGKISFEQFFFWFLRTEFDGSCTPRSPAGSFMGRIGRMPSFNAF